MNLIDAYHKVFIPSLGFIWNTIQTPNLLGKNRVVKTSEKEKYHMPNNMNFIDTYNLISGAYEQDEVNMLVENFQPSSKIIEIGSHIGVVSRNAYKRKLLPGGHMICIEPNPIVTDCLNKNIDIVYEKTII